MEDKIKPVAEVYNKKENKYFLLGEDNCLYYANSARDFVEPNKAELKVLRTCDQLLVEQIMGESIVEWLKK